MLNGEQQTVNLAQPDLGPAPPQMKEFDFFMGSWSIISRSLYPDGTPAAEHKGRWDAEYRNGGRMVYDECTRIAPNGEETACGITLRTFCPATDQWEMTFLLSLQQEHPQYFRGKFSEGEGHFEAVINLTPENPIMAKVRFFDIQKDSFEWTMRASFDEGENWFTAEHISAKRKP